MSENIWENAAKAMVASGQIPLPINDTMIELIQTLMNEAEAEFIQLFKKSMTLDEIKAVTIFNDDELKKILDSLMYKGVVTGIPSESDGQVVYRLMPPLPGAFEYNLMRGGTTEKDIKMAKLFDQLFKDVKGIVDENFDFVMGMFEGTKPITRVVPVNHDVVEKPGDNIIPHENVNDIVDKFDTIALVNCYCRHEQDLLGNPCKITDNRKNCMLFGKTARFVIDYEFGHEISRDEAKNIFAQSVEEGLVHKSFHVKADIEKDEYAICNCCKCCCGTIGKYHSGTLPNHVYASHVAKVDDSECISCEVCIERCPIEAISMDDIAVIDAEKCFGCGVCAVKCPTGAITLERTGSRELFRPPVRNDAKS